MAARSWPLAVGLAPPCGVPISASPCAKVHADPCSHLPFFQYRQIVFLNALGSRSPGNWRLRGALGTGLGSALALADCRSTGGGGDSDLASGAATASGVAAASGATAASEAAAASGVTAASGAAAEDVALP